MAEKAARNEVAVRSTEGPREDAPGAMIRKPRGRPKGSTNKPKSLVPKELASELLLIMKDQLPPEHFEYMKSVIKDGGAISTKQELDTMLLLLGRNLYPFLVAETKPQEMKDASGEPVLNPETGEPVMLPPAFRRDVTERLKVWKSLLDTRASIEKNEKPDDDGESPVLKLWASRGMEGRLAILVQGMTTDGPEPDGTADDRDAGGPRHLLGDAD